MSKLIIFDTETTGLEKEDKIIQVGAIINDLDNKDSIEFYDELCNSDIPIKIEAMAIHGIRPEKIKNKPFYKDTKFKKRLDELNNKENFLIAHNLDFDLEMLKKEGFNNNLNLIDTLQCAIHLYSIGEKIGNYLLPNYKLQTFRYLLIDEEEELKEAKTYKVDIQAHNAISDVIILKLFLRKLYIKISEKYNIKEKEAIFNKMAELTKLPAIIKVLNFGKYKGEKLIDIEKKDSNYIDWLFKEQEKSKKNNDIQFNKNLYFSLKEIINKRK